jgi:hypothetical protein
MRNDDLMDATGLPDGDFSLLSKFYFDTIFLNAFPREGTRGFAGARGGAERLKRFTMIGFRGFLFCAVLSGTATCATVAFPVTDFGQGRPVATQDLLGDALQLTAQTGATAGRCGRSGTVFGKGLRSQR